MSDEKIMFGLGIGDYQTEETFISLEATESEVQSRLEFAILDDFQAIRNQIDVTKNPVEAFSFALHLRRHLNRLRSTKIEKEKKQND